MSLRFPLVFWAEPPLLSFTACVITRSKERILTGTHGGLCVLWCVSKKKPNHDSKLAFFDDFKTSTEDENNNKGISFHLDDADSLGQDLDIQYYAEPYAVLHGHESTVTDICEAMYDFAPAACSVSLDGSLCVWNLSDGRCMAVSPFILTGSPTSIVSLPGGSQVACAGKHNKIEIIDLRLLKVTRTLEAHTEWVTSLSCGTIFENNDEKAVLVSVSEDQTLRYWFFENAKDKSDKVEWDQTPAFTVQAQTQRPLCVRHSDDFGYVLVVCEEKWMLFSFKSLEPKHVVDAPENKKLKGGFFVDASHVMVYTNDGDAYVYRVAKLKVPKRPKKKPKVEERNIDLLFPKKPETPTVTGGLKKEKSLDFKELNKPKEGDKTPTKSTSSYNLKDLLKTSNASTTKEAVGQISNNLFGALQGIAQKVKKDIGMEESSDTMKRSISMGFGLRRSPSQQNNAPSLAKSTSQSNLAAKNPGLKKSPSSNETPAMQKSPSQTTFPSTVIKSVSHSDKFKSIDNLNVAMDQTMSSNILDAFASSTPVGDEKPILLEVIREDAKIKESLGTCVWKSQQNIVVRANTSGTMKIWKVDINPEAEIGKDDNLLMFDNVASIDEKPVHVEVVTASTLADGWPKISQSMQSNNTITATQFAIDNKDKTSKLVHGYLDGHIVIKTLMSNDIPVAFKGHTARVTSLLVLNDDDNDRSLLVSGSADFTVKVWDIGTGKLINTFYFHSGTVNLLFTPPKTIRKKLQNCFCSVAEDKSVIIYSLKTLDVIHILGGHPSSVVSVYWRVDLDYLLVRCSDGSVCIWQLSTGLLERRVFGKVAAELIERSEGPGSCRRPTVKMSFSKQSAFAEQSKGFLESLSLTVSDTEPDVQLLTLSVRRLIGFMNTKKDLIRDTILKKETKETLNHSLISALAYTLQYGKNKHLQLLRDRLGISNPNPTPYIGLKGAGSTFSLIVPKASEKSHPFIFSPVLSALYIICSISVLNTLASIPEVKKVCQEIIQYYLHELPKDFERFEEPSFLWCAQFLKDSSKEIQSAARSVMGAVLQRMTLEQKKSLAEKLQNVLWNCQGDSPGSVRKQNVVVALAVLAYRMSDSVDNTKKQLIAAGLIEILENGGPQQTTAISLLGDGYAIWQYYIPDPAAFCRQLFQIAMPALLATDPKNFSDSIATDALQAFISMSSVDTKQYVEFINGIIVNSQQTSPQTLNAAITSVYPLVHKYPTCLVDHLVVITSLLLKVLDPHFPAIRDTCMSASTNILRYLVEVFPMVSFHQEKQKLAVGNHEGIVVIYDMRTASKWQLLEAHKSPVAAVAFSPNGELLATFSPKEVLCRVWSIDGSGVLNLLGVASRAIRSFEVPSANSAMKSDEVIKCVKFEWESNKMFALRTGKTASKISFSL